MGSVRWRRAAGAGKMGRKKQPLKPGPPSQPLRAQGKGGRKRIPTSAFDPAAGAAIAAALEPEKTFTVEKLVASRLKSGVKEYRKVASAATTSDHDGRLGGPSQPKGVIGMETGGTRAA